MADIRDIQAAGTTLSTFIHKLAKENCTYSLKWSILKTVPGNLMSTKGICRLCEYEKKAILYAPDCKRLLNKKSEILGACMHRTEKWRTEKVI